MWSSKPIDLSCAICPDLVLRLVNSATSDGSNNMLTSNYRLKSLIICFITIRIIPADKTPRINANKAFVVTKNVQKLKNSSHGHSKKLILVLPVVISSVLADRNRNHNPGYHY